MALSEKQSVSLLIDLVDSLDKVVSLSHADPVIIRKLLDEYALLLSSIGRVRVSLLQAQPVARQVFFELRVRLMAARVQRILKILNKADKSFAIIGPIKERA